MECVPFKFISKLCKQQRGCLGMLHKHLVLAPEQNYFKASMCVYQSHKVEWKFLKCKNKTTENIKFFPPFFSVLCIFCTIQLKQQTIYGKKCNDKKLQ